MSAFPERKTEGVSVGSEVVLHSEMEEGSGCHTHVEDSWPAARCSNVEDTSYAMDLSSNTLHHFEEEMGLLIVGIVRLVSQFCEVLVPRWVFPALFER